MAQKQPFLADPQPLFVPSPAFSVLTEHVPDDVPEPTGIVCRKCGCADLRVWRTRKTHSGTIRRERVCRHCGAKVITTERQTFS